MRPFAVRVPLLTDVLADVDDISRGSVRLNQVPDRSIRSLAAREVCRDARVDRGAHARSVLPIADRIRSATSGIREREAVDASA